MCRVRNPRNINIFGRVPGREDRVPGRGDQEIVYVPNVYVPFPAPIRVANLLALCDLLWQPPLL